MSATTFSRLRRLADPDHFPALSPEYIRSQPGLGLGPLDPAPRILLLYGSLRERSFSRLVVEETARLLGISRHTVGQHIKQIYAKLAVNSRSQAVYQAIQAGWVGTPGA